MVGGITQCNNSTYKLSATTRYYNYSDNN